MDKHIQNKEKNKIHKKRSAVIETPIAMDLSAEITKLFQVNARKKQRISEYMCRSIIKTKLRASASARNLTYPRLPSRPITEEEFREFTKRCPSTEMSRFQERDIRRKIEARGLEDFHPQLLSEIIKETKQEYSKIIKYACLNLKIKNCYPEVIFKIEPYKFVGKTVRYQEYITTRKQIETKWILHYPIIRKIFKHCVTSLPYELLNLNFEKALDLKEIKYMFNDKAQNAAQFVYEFCTEMASLTNQEENMQRRKKYVANHLGACTGILSVYISRSIAHTLLYIVKFTASKVNVPYLNLNISFKDGLVLTPTPEEVIETFHDFIHKVIDTGSEIYVLQRNKIKGYENKYMYLCLTEEFVTQCKEDIEINIRKLYEPIIRYLDNMTGDFKQIYSNINSKDFIDSISDIVFETGCEKITYYREYLDKVAYIPDHEYFHIGQMILTSYRSELQQGLKANIDQIFEKLCSQHLWEVNDICETFKLIHTRATQKPLTTEELVETGKYMSWIKSEHLSELNGRVESSLMSLCQIIELGILTDEHMELNSIAVNWLDKIMPVIDEHFINFEQLKFDAEEKLQKVIEDVTVSIKEVFPLLVILDDMDDINKVRSSLNYITLHMSKIKEIQTQISWINQEEVCLSFPKSTYSEFEDLKNYIFPFYHLLKLCLEVQKNLSVWQDGQFESLNYEPTRMSVDDYYKELSELHKSYRKTLRKAQDENLPVRFKGTVDDPDILNWPAPLKLCGKAMKLLDDFKPSVEVMKIICNKSLRKRHWKAISEIAGLDITPNAGTTLKKIMKVDFHANLNEYEIISAGATKEKELIDHLRKLQHQWDDIVFITCKYKETNILTHLEDIEAVLDDHSIQIINMKGSVFVKPHEVEVKRFYEKILRISRTIDKWDSLQRQWISLYPLFSAGYLSCVISKELELFDKVKAVYSIYIDRISEIQVVIKVVETTNILEDIDKCLIELEIIHHGVAAYLETTRQSFPRFHFLADDELLDIISQRSHAFKSQSFLTKIFQGIHQLDVNTEIIGMQSLQSENIKFVEAIDLNDRNKRLEELCSQIENQMVISLKFQMGECYKIYKRTNIGEILSKFPQQAIQIVSQVYWTENIESALRLTHNIKLLIYNQKLGNSLRDKIKIVNESNTQNLHRLKLKNLIINDLNNKYIITKILDTNRVNENLFEWEAHARYYFQSGLCTVQLMDTKQSYLHEYSGNSNPLILSPLTDRCYRTLINAHYLHFNGLLQGPSESGKSETIKGLATAIGVFFMSFSCPQKLNSFVLARFLKGSALCGSWLCFENFNNLTPDVLSVVSQDLLAILSTIRSGINQCFIGGIQVIINPTSFICTSVKGVRYNAELPENLKVLCRTMTMVAPDIRRIVETTLLCMGFKNALFLAKKIVCVYTAFQDFFPYQNQYCFGISRLKQILHDCEILKLENLNENEDDIVFHSIKKTIFPTLPKYDGQIFESILRDVFPNMNALEDDANLEEPILNYCDENNLQVNQEFLSTAKEIFLCLDEKFHTILLGNTLTGKTTMLNICQHIFTKMENISLVRHTVNSNCLSYDFLFGQLHNNSPFWSDGVITKIMRGFSLDKESIRKWLVFDGNIDDFWIENVNPILNGENTFYLESGEILTLNKSISIIFEVKNLNSASPTTLTEMILDEAFLSVNNKEEDTRNLSTWIQATIIQTGVMGLGSVLDTNSRHKFDEFYRHLWKGQNEDNPYPNSFEKLEVVIPPEGLIFDYQFIYKQRGNWKLYQDVLKNEQILESPFMYEFVVPTVDTLRYGFLLAMHIKYKYPTLLIGSSGTGKSLLIEDIITNKINKDDYEVSHINFSVNTSSQQIQTFILSNLKKRKSGLYTPSTNKNFLMFIDNLNPTPLDRNGTSGCLELLRQHMDHNVWYDFKSSNPIHLSNVNFVSAMGLIEEDTLTRIYSGGLLHIWKKSGFPSDINTIVPQIVAATFRVYQSVVKQFKPTINQCYYVFNLSNFTKVIRGCCNLKKETYDGNKKIYLKLWSNEILRVFGDRLQHLDSNWLLGNIKETIKEEFEEGEDIFDRLSSDSQQDDSMSKLVFGTFNDMDRPANIRRYEEITDLNHLLDVVNEFLRDYNISHTVKLDVIFSSYALSKLTKICRILSISPGNAILLGLSGSGRQSLTKLASFMYNQKLFQPIITKNYGVKEWNRDFKEILREAGGLEKQCVFLVSEEHLTDDQFLENIDWLLRHGEIIDLYDIDEKQDILELARLAAQGGNRNLDISSSSVFLYFYKRCRENLHLILSLDIGNTLRTRIRNHPSLMNCHVIWFDDWPDEALESIGHNWIRDVKFLEKEVKGKVIKTFVYFHRESQNLAKDIMSNSKLRVHVPSKSFKHLIKLFIELITNKQNEINLMKTRYMQGLEKLSYAATQIIRMQNALGEYQPQLEAMTQRAIEMTDQIALETIEVEKASALVRKDEKVASEQASVAQILKSECESELAQAIPILEDAISALNTLKPSDITLVKSMKNPPDAIKLVMAAVCVIKDVKPDRLPDPSTGRKTIDYWGPSKRILGDMNFLQTLKDFDKDHIKPEIIAKIRKEYLPHKDFKPHVVAKASSAAEGLCKWIIAMDMYDKVAKEVAPKKEKLEKAEKEYAETVVILNEKKEEVTRIEEKLAELNSLLEEATKKQLILQQEVDYCNKKLNSAQKLIGSLSGERIRWTDAVANLDNQYKVLLGNILISSGIVAYLAPYKDATRVAITRKWHTFIKEGSLPCSDEFDMLKTLAPETKTEYWLQNGLPQDHFFFDPQYQASSWIQHIERRNNLTITKFTDNHYLVQLRNCISAGKPILIHKIKEYIPPCLSDLLSKQTYVENEEIFIKLSNEYVKLHKSFRLYMVTNLRFPEFTPRVYNRITLINFTNTEKGLEEHLLKIVTEIEKPELKQLKKELYSRNKKNKMELLQLEDKILSTLCESETDILEDETSIKILDQSKDLVKIVREKQEETKYLQTTISTFNSGYASVAKFAANLFDCVDGLQKINFIYEFPFDWYVDLYFKSVLKSEKSLDIHRRCKNIKNCFIFELHCNTTHSLFKEDKLTFLFLLTIRILLFNKRIRKEELEFFLQRNIDDNEATFDNPAPHWINQKAWRSLCHIETIPEFQGFLKSFTEHISAWKYFFETQNVELEHFPLPWNTKLDKFKKLILLKILRVEQLFKTIKKFVFDELGGKFIQTRHFNLSDTFNESYSLAPILFILTPGADPMQTIKDFAVKKKVLNKFHSLTLGNDKIITANHLIKNARKQGFWLLLQNCHLVANWLQMLEQEIAEMDFENTHENFRLWLTSMPSETIPIELLQTSIKVIDEPNEGIKENLMKLYKKEPIENPTFYKGCPGRQEIFTRFLYGLTFFHCILQEKRKYGLIGWNTPYLFNDTDINISLNQLQIVINGEHFTSKYLEKLTYIVGQCHYSGHLNDEWDIRLVMTLLNDCLNTNMSKPGRYLFNNLKPYGLPKKREYKDYLLHISSLPRDDVPEIFGLNEFKVAFGTIEKSNKLILSLLDVLEEKNKKDVKESELYLLTALEDLLKKLPLPIDLEEKPFYNTVLLQEIKRYNTLLSVILNSLHNLRQAFGGIITISTEYEEMAKSIIDNNVPEEWLKFSYPSQRNLSSYVDDLCRRIEYFKNIKNLDENKFWLAAFFFPKALICKAKLDFSRVVDTPLDDLTFDYDIINNDTPVSNGFILEDLYIVGAKWDKENSTLIQLLTNLYDRLPPVLFRPISVVNYSE
ncbi:hypothetical protein NQ314_020365, partial [Rhamnusium bicolor]